MKQGYVPEQVVVTGGLPVGSEFVPCKDKSSIRQKLGLADRFTVLVFAGSLGEIPVRSVLKSMEKDGPDDMNVVFIAGRNKREKRRAEKLVASGKLTKVRVEGFVTNMNEFLAAADCVVSKSSGGALAECAGMGVPVVIREKMINNELRNQRVFSSDGAAIAMKKAKQAGQIVSELYADRARLAALSQKISEFSSVNAVANLMNCVEADFAACGKEA